MNVLDHGAIELLDQLGSDSRVIEAARVSVVGAKTFRADDRLIDYLWRNAHTGPFEHVVFTFRVKAPIFVLRQWMRHRTWSYNEVSGRYSVLASEFYLPEIDQIRAQSKTNKQGRGEVIEDADLYRRHMRQAMLESVAQYERCISAGMARELARIVLPVALYSEMVATVDLNNLFKFLVLRQDEHAQWEIRQFANAIADMIAPLVPMCWQAFKAVS